MARKPPANFADSSTPSRLTLIESTLVSFDEVTDNQNYDSSSIYY